MSQILIESQCLPPIPVLATIQQADTVWIEAHEHYQKRSYRNRIYLNSAQGLQLITIPLVKGKNAKTPIQSVMISYADDWPLQIRKHLQTHYGNAPFFAFYYEDLCDIFERRHKTLWGLNQELLSFCMSAFRISTRIVPTSTYSKVETIDYIDLRNHFTPVADPTILENDRLHQSVFPLHTDDWSRLSCIDLLMCYGPEAATMLSCYHTNLVS